MPVAHDTALCARALAVVETMLPTAGTARSAAAAHGDDGVWPLAHRLHRYHSYGVAEPGSCCKEQSKIS